MSASRPKIGMNDAMRQQVGDGDPAHAAQAGAELDLEPRQQHLGHAGIDLPHDGADADRADDEPAIRLQARDRLQRRRLPAFEGGGPQRAEGEGAGRRVVTRSASFRTSSAPWSRRSGAGHAGVERVGGADGGLADPIAILVGQRMQRPPAGAVAGDDVGDVEGLQRLDRLRDEMLHDAAQVQAAHHRMDRRVGKQALCLGADIDDAGVRAGAEHDEAEIAHVHDQHALVHQEGVGPPFLRIVLAAEMILAALLEGADPGDLAAVIEMIVEQRARIAVVDDAGALRFHLRRRGHARGREDRAVLQQYAALVEHAGIDVDRDAALCPRRLAMASSAAGSAPM